MRFISLSALFALIAASTVAADTEIRNIHLPLKGGIVPEGLIPKTHLKLEPNVRIEDTLSWNQTDQFYLISFDESYKSWTVRLSWPGTSPTKWQMDVSPLDTGRAVLYVSARPLSPRFPNYPILNRLTANLPSFITPYLPQGKEIIRSAAGSATEGVDQWATTYHVLLEPLVLGGLLPKTAVPAVIMIVLFVLGAAMVVPSLIKQVEAARAKAVEQEQREKAKKQK